MISDPPLKSQFRHYFRAIEMLDGPVEGVITATKVLRVSDSQSKGRLVFV